MDRVVTGISGMNGVLRMRDLPTFARLLVSHQAFDFFEKMNRVVARTSGLILNSSNELEGPVIDNIAPYF